MTTARLAGRIGCGAIDANAIREGGPTTPRPCLGERATGWQMKPQGACRRAVRALPVVKQEEWIADADGWVWFCYSDFADMIGQKHVRDGDVWSLGSVPEVRRAGLESAIAPDFEVTERNGNTLRLSDLRGHKVVLFTWSSW